MPITYDAWADQVVGAYFYDDDQQLKPLNPAFAGELRSNESSNRGDISRPARLADEKFPSIVRLTVQKFMQPNIPSWPTSTFTAVT